MRAKSVAVGKTAKGYDSSSEFPAKMLRSSLPLNLTHARVFVMDTAPMPERRRIVFSEGPMIGLNLRGATVGNLKLGHREWQASFEAGQVALMPQHQETENHWFEPFVIE